MKALVYEQYGPPEVLRLAELPIPEPKRERRGQVSQFNSHGRPQMLECET